jgi:hypothetical protein
MTSGDSCHEQRWPLVGGINGTAHQIWHRWQRGPYVCKAYCSFEGKYLREIESIFKKRLYSGDQMKLFDEKKPTSKVSCQGPFNNAVFNSFWARAACSFLVYDGLLAGLANSRLQCHPSYHHAIHCSHALLPVCSFLVWSVPFFISTPANPSLRPFRWTKKMQGNTLRQPSLRKLIFCLLKTNCVWSIYIGIFFVFYWLHLEI